VRALGEGGGRAAAGCRRMENALKKEGFYSIFF
jgi:hypothetical protein